MIILQTLPAIVFGLYFRFFQRLGPARGLFGLVSGLVHPNATNGKAHFGGPQYALSKLGFGDTKTTIYAQSRWRSTA